MRVMSLMPALLLAFLALPAMAGDLDKIDRTIAKEPAYQTKTPKYCLVVFGPEAKTRVWLVIDGNTLYVDRNGNGDLTEKDEKLVQEEPKDKKADAVKSLSLTVPDITEQDGKTKHTDFTVNQYDKSTYLYVSCGEGKRNQYAGYDAAGALELADSPKNAPVIHFNGPLSMGLHSGSQSLCSGGSAGDLTVVIGTPGIGKGTFASISYRDIPDDVHPKAAAEFPGKNGSPIAVTASLTKRC